MSEHPQLRVSRSLSRAAGAVAHETTASDSMSSFSLPILSSGEGVAAALRFDSGWINSGGKSDATQDAQSILLMT